MVQAHTLTQDRPTITFWTLPDDGTEVHRQEILGLLERAAQDNDFIAQLTDQGEQALEGCDLTWQEKAALLSGDVRWIELRLDQALASNVKLDARQRTWLDCRLEQEIW